MMINEKELKYKIVDDCVCVVELKKEEESEGMDDD